MGSYHLTAATAINIVHPNTLCTVRGRGPTRVTGCHGSIGTHGADPSFPIPWPVVTLWWACFWHALARYAWVASTCPGGSWSLLPIDVAVAGCALCHVPLVLTRVLVVAFVGSCVPHVRLDLCNLPSGLLVACPIVPCCGVCSWFLLPGSLPVCCVFKLVVMQWP